MFDDIDSCFGCLYIAKLFYDHGKFDKFPKSELMEPIGYDTYWETCMSCIYEITQYTGEYYNEEKDINTYYFSDPIITDFYRLCEKSGKGSHIRCITDEKIRAAFNRIDGYSWDYFVRNKTNRPYSSGIVFMYDSEFYSIDDLIVALFQVMDAYQDGIKQLRTLSLPVKAESEAA